MKSLFCLGILGLMIQSQQVLADNGTCQQQYGQAVAACAQSLQLLPPASRAGAQPACVAGAKAAKDACLAGGNTCLTTCESAYSSSVTTCNSTYDVTTCGSDTTCQAIIQQENADCISQATDILNSCTSVCPVTQ